MQTMSLGHTEEKHVTSKTQLRRRLYGCKKQAVSSYYSQEDAEKMIYQILQKNKSRINRWLHSQEDKLTLYGMSMTAVGFGYFKESEKVIFEDNLKKACVVLNKKKQGYDIVTSYLLR